MSVNEKQYGGNHYKKYQYQPWDVVLDWKLGYLDGTALKYIARWRDKNGIEDLQKAIHFLEKLIEVETNSGHKHVSERDQAVRDVPGGDGNPVSYPGFDRRSGGGSWQGKEVAARGLRDIPRGATNPGDGGCALVSSVFSPPSEHYDGGTCGQEFPETSRPSNKRKN